MKKYILIVAIIFSFNVNAANICGDDLGNNCWDCGKTAADNCTARLDGTKLTIEGDGYMADFRGSQLSDPSYPVRPWGNNIESVEISNELKSIGEYAFRSTKISEINVPASVESIGMGAVQDIKTLTNVTFEEGSKLESIGSGAFNGNPLLTEFDIPQGVTTIKSQVFNGSGIDSITLPDAVFSIDDINEKYFHGLQKWSLSDVDNIYCSDTVRAKCEEYFDQATFWENGVFYPIKEKATLNINNADGTVDTYRYGSDGTAAIYRDGKLKSYKGKRIFTIDEANEVAGKTNSFKIRYR